MANYCTTFITFHGDIKELRSFYNKLLQWTETLAIVTDFGPGGLANILVHAGLKEYTGLDGNTENLVSCRGSIADIEDIDLNTYPDDTDTSFYIYVDSAWEPMLKMWDLIFKKLNYKTLHYSFMAEESGNNLYWIYDPYGDYTDDCYVTVYLDGDDAVDNKFDALYDLGPCTIESFVKVAQELLKTTESDATKLAEKLNNYDFKSEKSFISVDFYKKLSNLDHVA